MYLLMLDIGSSKSPKMFASTGQATTHDGIIELAADARAVDMQASPYDLSAYGFRPIAVETPAGRAEYVRAQQDIAERAAPVRARLIDRCDRLLDALDPETSEGLLR